MRILETLKEAVMVMSKLGFDITITSGTDGAHSGPNDPHKRGEAFDIRSNTLTSTQKTLLLGFIQNALGSRFFAFLENPGDAAEHVHVQIAKGTTYSMTDYFNNA